MTKKVGSIGGQEDVEVRNKEEPGEVPEGIMRGGEV